MLICTVTPFSQSMRNRATWTTCVYRGCAKQQNWHKYVSIKADTYITCAYQDWGKQYVLIQLKKNMFLRNRAKSAWLCNQRSIKAEDFRLWTTHPERQLLCDVLHFLPRETKSSTALLSLWLCLARCQPLGLIASQTRTWSGLGTQVHYPPILLCDVITGSLSDC